MLHTKSVNVTFLPAGMLHFLMGKIVLVPSMRSCSGPFLPITYMSRRPNSLAVPRYQMGASVPFRSFRSDGCFPAVTGVA